MPCPRACGGGFIPKASLKNDAASISNGDDFIISNGENVLFSEDCAWKIVVQVQTPPTTHEHTHTHDACMGTLMQRSTGYD